MGLGSLGKADPERLLKGGGDLSSHRVGRGFDLCLSKGLRRMSDQHGRLSGFSSRVIASHPLNHGMTFPLETSPAL